MSFKNTWTQSRQPWSSSWFNHRLVALLPGKHLWPTLTLVCLSIKLRHVDKIITTISLAGKKKTPYVSLCLEVFPLENVCVYETCLSHQWKNKNIFYFLNSYLNYSLKHNIDCRERKFSSLELIIIFWEWSRMKWLEPIYLVQNPIIRYSLSFLSNLSIKTVMRKYGKFGSLVAAEQGATAALLSVRTGESFFLGRDA